MPISATRILPQCSGPSAETIPFFGSPMATVAEARTATPQTAPLVASRPEGRSMAIVAARRERINRMASARCPATVPDTPVPSIPSTTTSNEPAASRWASSSAAVSAETTSPPAPSTLLRFSRESRETSPLRARSIVLVVIPSDWRCLAATKASPPLFPFPAKRRTRGRSRPARIIPAAQRATAAPARSINPREGTPRPTMAARSSSLICAAVTSFMPSVSARGYGFRGPARAIRGARGPCG